MVAQWAPDFSFRVRGTDMLKFSTAVRSFIRGEDGAALVEYAILVALIAVVAIFFVTSLGTKVSQKFSDISGSL
jgi:pilus assembly protein Flp/PilA